MVLEFSTGSSITETKHMKILKNNYKNSSKENNATEAGANKPNPG